MRERLIFTALLALAATVPASAQTGNVLQDCWTSDGVSIQQESYRLSNGAISFVWKHKIVASCNAYKATIVGLDCVAGLPKPARPARWAFVDLDLGQVNPGPDPERIFVYEAPAGSIPAGTYDWMVRVECNDSAANGVRPGDGDIEDYCGISDAVLPTFDGPVAFGPARPHQGTDPHPGGAPAGRVADEDGTTRPWCFEVLP